MLKVEDIVEEIAIRIAQLEKFVKDYQEQGNQHGYENVKNRADELKRLKQFIDDRLPYEQYKLTDDELFMLESIFDLPEQFLDPSDEEKVTLKKLKGKIMNALK